MVGFVLGLSVYWVVDGIVGDYVLVLGWRKGFCFWLLLFLFVFRDGDNWWEVFLLDFY